MRAALAAAIFALLIQPANSQIKPTLKRGMGGNDIDPRVEQYRKNIEEEYNAALKKIPDKKTKSDPWSDLRGNDPAKKKH